MKVAAIQMVSGTQSAGQPERPRAMPLLAEAARAAAPSWPCCPSIFACMGQRDTDKLAIQEPFGRGPACRSFWRVPRASWPVDRGRHLAAARCPATVPGCGVRNSTLVFDPRSGACVARYDKIHLFRFDNGH